MKNLQTLSKFIILISLLSCSSEKKNNAKLEEKGLEIIEKV